MLPNVGCESVTETRLEKKSQQQCKSEAVSRNELAESLRYTASGKSPSENRAGTMPESGKEEQDVKVMIEASRQAHVARITTRLVHPGGFNAFSNALSPVEHAACMEMRPEAVGQFNFVRPWNLDFSVLECDEVFLCQ